MVDPHAVKGVFLVDDHPIVRHGLSAVINQVDHLEVVAEAGSVEDAWALVEAGTVPDVMLVDLSLKDKNGLELIKKIRSQGLNFPMLVLSMHDESMYAERSMRAGANGYLMKEDADESVIDAIETVLAGDLYASEAVKDKMLRQFIDGGRNVKGVESLSDRELEVFEWIGNGFSSQQVAEKLGLSVKTVEAHRARIKKKLAIDNATQFVQAAVRWVEDGR